MLTLHRWAYELQRVTGQGGGHHKEPTAKCADQGERASTLRRMSAVVGSGEVWEPPDVTSQDTHHEEASDDRG